METVEFKDVKRDSFEEMDRILIIVEGSKRDMERAKEVYFRSLTITFLVCSLGFVGVLYLYSIHGNSLQISTKAEIVDLLWLAIIFVDLGSLGVLLLNPYRELIKRKKDYRMTAVQAADVIREIIPALSHSEHWSALRNFELRLRLSKLGISSERLFSSDVY